MIALQSLVFDRRVGRTPAALPLAAASRSELADLDWERRDRVHRQAVAYPRTVNDVPLTITVGLDLTTPLTGEVLVRARVQAAAALGDVEPFTIPAQTVGSFSCTSAIDARPLTNHAPARTTLQWIWEQSDNGGRTWTEFERSKHEIYVLLAEPKFPWGRPGSRDRIAPWEDVIEEACKLAAGAATPEKVRRAITTAIHALGGQLIPDGSGASNPIGWQATSNYQGMDGTMQPIFNCSDFIKLLRRQRTEHYLINCLDCASAIATFATALGVEMQLVTLGPEPPADALVLNGVRLIGDPDDPPTTFSEHWVASLGPKDGFRVWDACLQLDFDAGAAEDFQLSIGLPFDETGTDLTYRSRFLRNRTPKPDVTCESPSYPDRAPDGAIDFDNPIRSRRRAKLHGQVAGVHPTSPLTGVDAMALLRRLEGATTDFVETRPMKVAGTPYVQFSVPFTFVTDAGRRALRLSVVCTHRPDDAVQCLLDLLLQYTTPLEPMPGIGDIAFHSPADESMVVMRGTLVISLQNDARRSTAIGPVIRSVDAAIIDAVQALISSS